MAPGLAGPIDAASGIPSDMLAQGKWWRNPGILKLNILLLIPFLTSYNNGFDGSMMNGLQLIDSWNLYFDKPEGAQLGLLNAIQSIGALVSAIPAFWLADRFGRRFPIIFGATIVLVAAILQACAQNIEMFTASRFFIGFGTTFAHLASPLLIVQTAYPTHRAKFGSLYNTMWFSGAIVAAWATFGTFRISSTWSWRIPSLLQGLASIIQIAFFWWIPESPRWLIKNGRNEEALNILARFHANGDKESPLVVFEAAEIKEAIRIEEEATAGATLKSLFQSRGNRRRMRITIGIAVFSQWSGNGLISYYFGKIMKSVGIQSQDMQTLLNGCLQIFNALVAVGASLLVERLGRRTLFVFSNALMLLFWSALTACTAVYAKQHSVAAGNVAILFIFLYNFAYAIAYSPLLVLYVSEIWPYGLRAKALSFMNVWVTAAIIFQPQTNPIAQDAMEWRYYCVYVGWLVFELVFIWFFCLETKGRTLEETALLFDGKAENVALAGADEIGAYTHEKGDNEKDAKASDDIIHGEKI